MKKTIAILLTICTVLSICSFSAAAAPEGTAINSAAEFAAMAADGKYYLASDITLDATYAETFKGTLDGNGKTVTVSAPMFATLENATIKNLNVEGAIAYTVAEGETAPDSAAVAVNASGVIVLDNIVNKASVTGAANAAGIVALINGGTATVTNCANYGEINASAYVGGVISTFGTKASSAEKDFITISNCKNFGTITCGGQACGGILGYLSGGLKLTDSENHGTITNTSNMAGGIFGTPIKDLKNVCAVEIANCVNYGNVYATTVIAGIAARLGRAVAHTEFNYCITNCVNYGTIASYTGTPESGISFYISGIAGYAYGGSGNEISNCVNAGDIIADTTHADAKSSIYIGGAIGYVNSKSYTIANNVNLGTVTFTTTPTAIGLVAYNKSAENTLNTNNYSVSTASDVTFTDAASTVIVTADQIASGEVASLINEAAGATVYYQAIGTDKAPTPFAAEDGSNTIIKNADGTYSNPVKEPEVTEPETTEPEVSEKTGDSSVIFAVVAVLSILGVAVVAKRREN